MAVVTEGGAVARSGVTVTIEPTGLVLPRPCAAIEPMTIGSKALRSATSTARVDA